MIYKHEQWFKIPYSQEGLGLTLPGPGWGVEAVCEALGTGHVLDIIDCHRQKTCQMTVDQFAQNFTDPQ